MSTEQEIDLGQIPPSILVSMKSNPCSWSTVIGELVDNSLDAGATRVDIEFSGKSMTVTDDGQGCDNIEKMLTIGAHYRQSSTKLGRYGVGLKDAACWLWGRLVIRTTRNGHLHRADVDWETLSKSKSWKIVTPAPTQLNGHGTQLMFKDFIRKAPDFESLADQLGYMFAPAIKDARQIRIFRSGKQPICVKAWETPDLTQIVNERFEIAGKRVHLYAGIVAAGHPNEKSGFNVCHAHRMITNTSFGSNGYSTARICGVLTLDSGWDLTLITFEEMEREERSKLFADFSGFVEALSSVLTAQQASELQPVSEGVAR